MREGAALALGEHQRAIEQALGELLAPDCAAQPVLAEAMRYAVMGGGKRLRPLLAFAAAEVFGVPAARAIVPACALELIHSYSLIHDDLPAMDDDALRRGRATCHIRFGEALAILAGDALQALAFELVAKDARLQVEAG